MHLYCLAGCLWCRAEQWLRNCVLHLLMSHGAFPEHAFIWGRTQLLNWGYVQQKHKWGWFNTAGRQGLSLTGNLAFHFLRGTYVCWKWLHVTGLHLLVLSSCLSADLMLVWIFLSLGKYWAFKEEIGCLLSVYKEGQYCWVRIKHLGFQFYRDVPLAAKMAGKIWKLVSLSHSVQNTLFRILRSTLLHHVWDDSYSS